MWTVVALHGHVARPQNQSSLGEEMSIGQIPSDAKFCGYPTRSVRDIRDW